MNLKCRLSLTCLNLSALTFKYIYMVIIMFHINVKIRTKISKEPAGESDIS